MDHVVHIAVGTHNKAKIQAVKEAFSASPEYSVHIEGMSVASGVAEQPFSDEETISGAIHRARAAKDALQASIGIGLEGGVTDTSAGLFICNWGALLDRNDEPFVAGGARILLPQAIADRLRNGEELGPVMDDVRQRQNIRHHEGAVGIFTNGRINRIQMFTHVVQLLIGQWEFRNK
ncbi:DUF84 family protein [Jeotgalibacillus soli]|uniref:Probable inosine/xanthosine triphosphatase n=1 Tax=Jeotgalibacillus soli TaxID=889306 RepID=A0A0C2VIR5_9BACL|nr:DUF84 family protein [Jeotgalibacillus soli]KIL43893.1 NTPase [Jeotgalibacillus soli]